MTVDASPWILVTGNGGFGDTAHRKDLAYVDNPTSAIALSLDGEEIAGMRVRGVSLDWTAHPVEALDGLISADHPPVAVLSLGVFSGRTTVTVERLAANVQDFQFAENDGRRPAGEPVFDDGPAAYLATLPIKGIVHAVRAAGIPALVSNSASTHGCNSVMYTALHLIAQRGLPTLAGFVHLPDPPEHVAALASNGPSMSVDLQTRAIRVAIEAIGTYGDRDLVAPVGEWEW